MSILLIVTLISIFLVAQAKSLGVVLDYLLSFAFIRCPHCMNFKNISRILPFLTTLLQNCISSSLVNCNSFLVGISIFKLLAFVVCFPYCSQRDQIYKSDDSTQLKTYHLLPISLRIKSSVLVMPYKALQCTVCLPLTFGHLLPLPHCTPHTILLSHTPGITPLQQLSTYCQ